MKLKLILVTVILFGFGATGFARAECPEDSDGIEIDFGNEIDFGGEAECDEGNVTVEIKPELTLAQCREAGDLAGTISKCRELEMLADCEASERTDCNNETGFGADLQQQARNFGIECAAFSEKCNSIQLIGLVDLTIQFELGEADILPSEEEKLREIAASMNLDLFLGDLFLIVGHTDVSGGDEINIPLSRDRASSVKQALVLYGVEPWRLITEGAGSRQLLPQLDEMAGEHRRVTFGRSEGS